MLNNQYKKRQLKKLPFFIYRNKLRLHLFNNDIIKRAVSNFRGRRLGGITTEQ